MLLAGGGDDKPYGPYYGPLIPENPPIKYFEADKRGYFRAKLTHQTWRTDVRFVNTVAQQKSGIRTGASFVVEDGLPGVQSISVLAARPAELADAEQQGRGRLADR